MARPSPSLELRLGETAASGIRRVVGDLIDDAIWRLENEGELGTKAAVHQTRKRCKEARGVLRLARGGLGEDAYKAANGVLRDASRLLSDLRDNHAMLSTFDALVNASVDEIPPQGVGSVRKALRERALTAGRKSKMRKAKLTAARRMLKHARRQLDDWAFDHEDLDVFGWGLERTYRRARSAMAAAEATSDPHILHDWRKRVKYGWYHAQVLRPAAPSVLAPMASMRHRLSDGLGDLHDLDVIVEMAQNDPAEFGGTEQVDAVASLAKSMQRELERRVVTLGHRLYSEPPAAHTERVLGYLSAWREAGAELEVGEISDLFGADDGLAELTKGALREIAADADIKGRWSMSRKELLTALRASGVTA